MKRTQEKKRLPTTRVDVSNPRPLYNTPRSVHKSSESSANRTHDNTKPIAAECHYKTEKLGIGTIIMTADVGKITTITTRWAMWLACTYSEALADNYTASRKGTKSFSETENFVQISEQPWKSLPQIRLTRVLNTAEERRVTSKA